MPLRARIAILAVGALLVGACGGAASPTPTNTVTGTPPGATSTPVATEPVGSGGESPEPTAGTAGPVCEEMAAELEGDLLGTICERGTIVMSTDPEYPPQSSVKPDGTYEGFDIDVGMEIATRLGVELAYQTPAWEVLTAGSWQERWDFSVGSMTITSDREAVIDFTQPYYYTPAQMAALTDLGYDSLDDLAGKTICVGQGTTYLQWLRGTLDFGTASPQTEPPEGSVATTLKTDRHCANAWGRGRRDYEGWLTSATTVQAAIDDELPVTAIGEPVFSEPLAVAFDKSAPAHDKLVAAVDQILSDMHADGTLVAMSTQWFGEDLTVDPSL